MDRGKSMSMNSDFGLVQKVRDDEWYKWVFFIFALKFSQIVFSINRWDEPGSNLPRPDAPSNNGIVEQHASAGASDNLRRAERDEPQQISQGSSSTSSAGRHEQAQHGSVAGSADDFQAHRGLNISQRVVTTKYGQLRGFVRQIDAGVAYAAHFKDTRLLGED